MELRLSATRYGSRLLPDDLGMLSRVSGRRWFSARGMGRSTPPVVDAPQCLPSYPPPSDLAPVTVVPSGASPWARRKYHRGVLHAIKRSAGIMWHGVTAPRAPFDGQGRARHE